MSSEIAIHICELSKSFPVYEKPYHRLMQMLAPGPRERWFKEFQALKDIDLTVRRGETVGIVGRNGSGKSTLLQIICSTLTPSNGTVLVHGRVAALLELGAGFNPEFTGRENVYLNATVLGLTRREIDACFDDIAAFADIGEFIEQPVKSYSSGMYIRLAFAVAIHVTPDILVIDEALSVGDEAFQRKCFARINSIRDAGATILFVSHSAGTVIDLCDRAVLLDHGELLAEGTPKFVVSRYHKMLYAPAHKEAAVRDSIKSQYLGQSDTSLDFQQPAPAAGIESVDDEAHLDDGLVPQSTVRYQLRGACIEDPHIETLQGRRVNVLAADGEYIYTYRAKFQCTATAVRFGMMIKTITGLELGGAASAAAGTSELIVESGREMVARFRFRAALAPDVYFLNAGITAHSDDGETYLDRIIDAAMFRIKPKPHRLATGCVNFDVRPEIGPVNNVEAA